MPEELIFFAVIIFFSIIESISRSRKAKQQQGGAQQDLPLPEEWEPDFPTTDLPTYDADPSYDDPAAVDARERARTTYREEQRRSASQTMLPSELFEELAGLAGRLEQERTGAQTISIPKQSPELPAPEPERVHEPPDRSRVPATTRSKVPVGRRGIERTGPHIVHRAHAEYGTDPSERAPSEQDGLDPLARFLSEDASAIRTQLLSHTGPALRQAIMIQEVLAKPVSLRDE